MLQRYSIPVVPIDATFAKGKPLTMLMFENGDLSKLANGCTGKQV